MKDLLYFAIAFAIVIGLLKLYLDWRIRKHRGVPREAFISTFVATGIPYQIAATVYDFYKSGVVFKSFGVAPEDDYETVLRKGEEDIEDDSRLLLKQLGLKYPAQASVQEWHGNIRTLRDMVLWLDWVRQHQ